MKLIFVGTPHFGVPILAALHARGWVQGVVSAPDRPSGRGLESRESEVSRCALALGLPLLRVKSLRDEANRGELLRFARREEGPPDFLVVAAFGQILPSTILELPPRGCINVHTSLLPRWRGAAPVARAIWSGDTHTGISIMRMERRLDTGPIYAQQRCEIDPRDTTQSLEARLAKIAASLIGPTLESIIQGAKALGQEETLVTYAAKLEKSAEALWPRQHSAIELDRQIRACTPWPGSSVHLAGQRLLIRQARPLPQMEVPPGQLESRFGMLLLGTAAGALEIETLQWAGKKPTDVTAFLNGLRGKGLNLPRLVDDA